MEGVRVVLLLVLGLSLVAAQNLEDEVDIETKKCMDLAKLKHPDDPSKRIDHFLFCLTNQLEQVTMHACMMIIFRAILVTIFVKQCLTDDSCIFYIIWIRGDEVVPRDSLHHAVHVTEMYVMTYPAHWIPI